MILLPFGHIGRRFNVLEFLIPRLLAKRNFELWVGFLKDPSSKLACKSVRKSSLLILLASKSTSTVSIHSS